MELLGPVRSWPLSSSATNVTPTRGGRSSKTAVNTSTASAPSVRRIWSNENRFRNDAASLRNKNNNNIVNPYQVLQVRKDATNQEIRHAYRRLALWHHPGRGTLEGRRRRKRDDMFLVLAACCETLLERESRSRCDALLLLRHQRQQTESTSTITTASRTPRMHNRKHHAQPECQQQNDHQDNNANFTCRVLPFLTRTFSDLDYDEEEPGSRRRKSASFDSPTSEMRLTRKSSFLSNPSTPPLLWTESAGSIDNPNNHSRDGASVTGSSCCVSQDEDGPLSLLHQARHGRSFSGPYEFFERIFGYPVFPQQQQPSNKNQQQQQQQQQQQHGRKHSRKHRPGWSVFANSVAPLTRHDKNSSSADPSTTTNNSKGRIFHRNSVSATWTGSAQMLPDGSKVHTTTRILNNRRLVKTEVWKIDPKTGQPQSTITVTGEDLEEDSKSSSSCSSSNSDHDKDDQKSTNCRKKLSCCWSDAGCSTWSIAWCGGTNALNVVHEDADAKETRDYHHYYAHKKRMEQATKTPPRTPPRSLPSPKEAAEEDPVMASHLARLARVAW